MRYPQRAYRVKGPVFAAAAVMLLAALLSPAFADGAQAFTAEAYTIRIPAGCQLGERVFDGCTKVYVFGAAGSDAERYCSEHPNCVFVEDAQE